MTVIDTGVIPEIDLPMRMVLARRHSGLTQHEMAESLEIGIATVQRYENGRTNVKRPTLLAWAAITGVSLDWLTSGFVHPLGLEPRTHWLRAFSRGAWDLAA